jgi:hypothetical protein
MSKKVDYHKQVRQLQTWSPGIYAVLIAGVFLLMRDVTYQTTLTHQTNDILQSVNGAVLVPASHAFMDISLRWLLTGMLVLGLVSSILHRTRLKAVYSKAVKNGAVFTRWLDIGFTAAFVVTILAMFSGVHDIATQKFMAVFVLLASLFAWTAERALKDGKKLLKPIVIGGLLSGIVPWLLIVSSAVATPFYAAVRSPWYVYATYGAAAICFALIGLNLRGYLLRKQKDNARLERNYQVLNLLLRVSVTVILIVGVKK